MKRIINLILVLTSMFSFSSCLDANLKELDTYDGCDIASVQGVYHRYYTDTQDPLTGENRVKQVNLTVAKPVIDKDAATCTFNVTIPSNFPASEKENVDASKMVVVFNISTAAIIEPVGNSPALGVPGDWTGTNQYLITAANGDTKTWSVTLTLIK